MAPPIGITSAAATATSSMPMSVVSNAAICTLTVSKDIVDNDPVLQLFMLLVSHRQVEIKVLPLPASCTGTTTSGTSGSNSRGKTSTMVLEHMPTTTTGSTAGTTIRLTQRAAILRALAGTMLHYTLDSIFLGGHGAASQNAGSTKAVLAMSSLMSWMTVAQELITKEEEDAGADADEQSKTAFITSLLEQLETHLERNAFLIPSSQATLADMELCVALLRVMSSSASMMDLTTTTPCIVMQWVITVHAQMTDLGATTLPPLPPQFTMNHNPVIPMFFYGTEESTALPVVAPIGVNSSGAKKPSTTITSSSSSSLPSTTVVSATGGGLTDEEKKAAAEKRAKKAAEKAKKKPAAAAPAAMDSAAPTDAAVLDISALDIRIGKIIKAWHHPDAEKLFCQEIDVGEAVPRLIASGLRPFYKTEDLLDRHVLVLCNLKSRNLVGFPSHGMVLCASNEDHTTVEYVGVASNEEESNPTTTPIIGERVVFSDLEMKEPEAESKVAKKKIAEKLLPDLRTNSDGLVVWKGIHIAQTSQGCPIKAVHGMPNAHVG